MFALSRSGGPIRRDKIFFFAAYEGQRLHTASNTVLTVPTLLQRDGDFSQTLNGAGKLIPIYDPATTQLVDGSTFYLLPMVNPDGRAAWFRDAHNPNSSRSGTP